MPNSNTAEAAKRNSNFWYSVSWRLQWTISKPVGELHWWTSLVPAPAVIPAPIAYINAAAVKKLVVGSRVQQCKVASFVSVAPVAGTAAD